MASRYDYTDRFCFFGEWYDYETEYLKRFLINYYPSDNTIELFDRDLNRIYLKRSTSDDLCPKALFVGNKINVYGRQLTITDYGDQRTRTCIGKSTEHTFAILKPTVFDRIGECISHIEDRQFQIVNLKMCHLTQNQVIEFYQGDQKDLSLPFIVQNMIAGPVVALELVGDDAISRWREAVGPTDPLEARRTHPKSLRAVYGFEKFSNGFHAADSHAHYVKESAFFFGRTLPQTVRLGAANTTTCCVIKPHAIKEGKLGLILTEITRKFRIGAMQMFHLSKPNAEEFVEVYKDAVRDFREFLSTFLDGPCVALEICSMDNNSNENVHQTFRQFVGPHDAAIARRIRPNTLRAKFGVNKYKNAIHCTDLPEDTQLEVEFFFKILDQ